MNQNQRKHIALIVIVLWGCMPLYSGAQTSIEHLYNTLTGDNVRLCTEFSTGNSIISYNSHENNTPISFIYHKQNASSTYLYKCVEGVQQNGDCYSYDVKDIEIGFIYCYFCGTFYTHTYEYVQNGLMSVTHETGYIGRFLMSEISSGATMTIEFRTIPNTKSLNKLEIYGNVESNNYVDYLGLLGVTSTDQSCLAVVRDNGTSVTYGLLTTPTTETLTDLSIMWNYLVTVSRFDGEPYTFGLRAERLTNIPNTIPLSANLPYFPYLTKFNTINVNTQPDERPENPTFHSDEVEMKIAGVYVADEAVVAYDCIGGAFDQDCNKDLYHTALFYIDHYQYDPIQNHPMRILNSQLVSKEQPEERSLVSLVCPDYTSTILFHSYPSGSGDYLGEIQFPVWAPVGSIDNLTIDYRVLQDMCYRGYSNNRTINFAGFKAGNGKIVHFMQNVDNRETSCYSIRPKATAEEMTLPITTNEHSNLQTAHETLDWEHTISSQPVQVEYDVDCNSN